MGEGGKALKKAWGLEGLHVERERREKRESISLEEKMKN